MKTSDLLNAVCKALKRDPGTVTLDDTPDTLIEWDSLGHLSIIAMIDSLGVSTNTTEIQTIASVRDLVSVLKSKGLVED